MSACFYGKASSSSFAGTERRRIRGGGVFDRDIRSKRKLPLGPAKDFPFSDVCVSVTWSPV